MEIFKDVQGYEGYYQISNIGNFKSLSRKNNYGKYGGILKETIRIPYLTKKGYYRISLSKNGKIKGHLIHQLIAMAFLANPDNKPQVNHINGIKTDNRVENLEWATNLENQRHARATGLKTGNFGSKNHRSKIVLDISYGIFYETIREVCNITGMKRHDLERKLNGNKKNDTKLILV